MGGSTHGMARRRSSSSFISSAGMSIVPETEAVISQLRDAVRTLRMRGLKHAAKFAAELLLGIPEEIRLAVKASRRPRASDNDGQEAQVEEEEEDMDRYDAARASLDNGEYLRAHQMLVDAPIDGPATRFLRYYALYLAGEKAKEEMDLEISVTGSTPKDTERLSHVNRQGVNPHLKELYLSLSADHRAGRLDGHALYLFAVVLRRLGNDAPDGAEMTTRRVLLEAIRLYPWNWSAWMELAALSPFTSHEEEASLSAASPWMFHLFEAHVLLDQQQTDAARQVLDHLAALFPQSTYLLAQQALTSYHLRDFDQAQDQFEQLVAVDPQRLDTMDVYSNVLYVKEDKSELSRLAHRALQVEKYRPETCCIIGNYYSLKNKHDRAIVYFHRALKLDPNFLSAWTLIGHEYVELKNTSAAIEAYRRAVTLNARDYRAWYGLGQAYEILNMYLYSIYYYKKAAAIRPYDARMWCALGGCYEKLGKSDEAITCFERAVRNQDREGVASYHLGRILAQRGRPHAAAKYYQLHLGLRDLSTMRQRSQAEEAEDDEDVDDVELPRGATIRLDTPQALAAVLFLANYWKEAGRFQSATLLCNRLLDVQGPEKEEAKALLREMRSLDGVGRSRA
ncbi:hypothetical protein P43SY_003049 [Pythium insidiosum]|uniref:Cdc23 domain-containing protein n=1 Tax=Pythium insidiosum TaxID=114742 RepID=A0AAD5QAY6_PYTIN|nr:hypothetical protein P43SY_003049 [Pythium insidiosum]